MVRDRNFYKTIFRLAVPSAFQSLVGLLVVLVDNMMVSQLGSYPFAAVSQANAISTVFTAIIMGLAGGASVLISQYWGKRDVQRIRQVFAIVMTLSMSIAVLVVGAALMFPRVLMGIVVKSAELEVTGFAVQYFGIMCLSYLPFAASAALVGMLKSVEVVRVTLYTSIMALFVNIFLNYTLIFGHFGFPAMGVRGAALATVIARVLELVVVWLYVFRIQKQIEIHPRDLMKSERWMWRDYAKYGLPVSIVDTQWSIVGLLKASIIGHLTSEFMSAVSITDMMMNLGTLFTFALAGGASVVIGKTVGAREYEKTREYSKTIQIMFFGMGLFMATLVFSLRGWFVGLYDMPAEVNALAFQMVALGALTLIGTTYHASCFVGINRGAGDSRFVMMVDMICGWAIVLPITLLAAFVFRWPLPVVYLCTRIDQCFKWIIAFFRLRGDKWIRNVTRESVAQG